MQEKWREVYTEKQIKNLQILELKNLKVLQAVCEKLKINFFLYGGSLIGAVRHKGFVPWDDDLDIAMLREDYDRFVREAYKYLPDEYYLQTPYNDKKSPYYYSKLRLKGTKCVEYGTHKMKIEHGIYVDIYPIDNIPNDDAEYIKTYNKFQRTVKLFVLRQCPYGYYEAKKFTTKIRRTIKYLLAICLRIVPHSVYVKKLDKLMTYANGSKTSRMGNYSYPKPVNLFRSIQPVIKGEFEGIEVDLPNDWEWHLNSRYGNYMELPPEEERLGHKPYILDFGSYEV